LNAQDQWFAAVEEFLLSTLDQARSFDEISTTLDALPAPLTEASISSSNGILAVGDAMVGIVTAGKTFQDSLLMLRRSNHESSAAASFWWTEGGGNFPPMALCSRGMPDPFRYSSMLTGRLDGDEIKSAS
jgi:type VI secretion system protein ImpM